MKSLWLIPVACCGLFAQAIAPPGTSGARLLEPVARKVSYSPGGPAALRVTTGQVVKSVQLVSVVACSPNLISGGLVWQQAIAAGYEPIDTAPGDVLTQAARESKWAKSARYAGYGTAIVAGLMTTGMISASARPIVGVLMGHAVADAVTSDIAAKVPNPSGVVAMLVDPSQVYGPGPSGCARLAIVARFRKTATYRAVTLPLE